MNENKNNINQGLVLYIDQTLHKLKTNTKTFNISSYLSHIIHSTCRFYHVKLIAGDRRLNFLQWPIVYHFKYIHLTLKFFDFHNAFKVKGFHIVKGYFSFKSILKYWAYILYYFQCVSRIGKQMYFQYICWKCKINGTYTCSRRLRHGSDL